MSDEEQKDQVEGEEEPEEETGPKLRHDDVEQVGLVGTYKRKWRCNVCELEGTMDALADKSCTRSLSAEEKAETAVVVVARESNPDWTPPEEES